MSGVRNVTDVRLGASDLLLGIRKRAGDTAKFGYSFLAAFLNSLDSRTEVRLIKKILDGQQRKEVKRNINDMEEGNC